MTLSVADFNDTVVHYAYQCATCSARYIVNIQPTAGNGGAGLYGFRQTPHGADEARAMALHCCHDEPEPTNGVAAGQGVYWTLTPVVGSTPHFFIVADAPAEAAVVREYREWVMTFVESGESEIWSHTERQSADVEIGTVPVEIYAMRIDVVIDESPEGRQRDWAQLLAGLRLHPMHGDRDLSYPHGLTVASASPTIQDDGMRDLITSFHGDVHIEPFYNIGAGHHFRVILRYVREQPIPIGFFRLVLRGNSVGG